MKGCKLATFVANDSMGDALYIGCTNISWENVIASRNKLVSEIKISLKKVSNMVDIKLVSLALRRDHYASSIAFTMSSAPRNYLN